MCVCLRVSVVSLKICNAQCSCLSVILHGFVVVCALRSNNQPEAEETEQRLEVPPCGFVLFSFILKPSLVIYAEDEATCMMSWSADSNWTFVLPDPSPAHRKGDLSEDDKAYYENLPFHGLQSPQSKVS